MLKTNVNSKNNQINHFKNKQINNCEKQILLLRIIINEKSMF